jgi:uncharacterized membrane protein YccC
MTMINVALAPVCFAGIELRRWLYAIRIWVATVVALGIAFWLQLDGASTAAVTVSILALQTHGQTFQKSTYRLAGTVIGVAASILIADCFSQTPDLYIVVVAVWLALCVFVAGMFDGNRAYGAVLSGYTVCIVAVLQIDTPQNVFMAGMNRGAAMVAAIVTLAVVNTLMGALSVHTGLEAKLRTVRSDIRVLALQALQGDRASASATADLMRRLTTLHPEVTAVYLESARGLHRAQSVRKLVTALVVEIEAVYALGLIQRGARPAGLLADQSTRDELVRVLRAGDPDRIRSARACLANDDPDPSDLTTTGLIRLLDAEATVADAFAADRAGDDASGPRIRLRLYRSRRTAAWNAGRIMLTMLFVGLMSSYANWPATATIYGFVGVLAALGATTANVRMFSKYCFTGAIVAAAIAGAIQFLVLGGIDQFAWLAIALAPPTVGATLLQSSAKASHAVFGFVLLCYVPMILAPSNPESFNPESFLQLSLFTIVAGAVVYFSLIVFPPPSEQRRLRWMLEDAREDAWRTLQNPTSIPIEEAIFRDADRIGQIAVSVPQAEGASGALERALLLTETAAAARATHAALADAETDDLAASSALATFDGAGLRQAAQRAKLTSHRDVSSAGTAGAKAASLLWAAALADLGPFESELKEAQ